MDALTPTAPDATVEFEPPPNIDRLIEDLTATLPLFDYQARRQRWMHPSASTLEILGEKFISDDPTDERAARLRANPWDLRAIVANGHLPLLSGRVRLSYFLAAIVYARRDLYPSFMRTGQWDWQAALQWLVLHGVQEHRLWPFLSVGFVGELLARTIWADEGPISVLQLCVLRECPELRRIWPAAGSPQFDETFKVWLREEGTQRFRLFWLRTRTQMIDVLAVKRRASGGSAQDIRYNSGGKGRQSGEPVWAQDAAPKRTSHQRSPSGGAYKGFGPDYPCVSVNCLDSSLLENGVLNGLARLSPDRSSVELLEPRVALQLPASWLPPSVMLLDLDVAEGLKGLAWIRIMLDKVCVDSRPAIAGEPGPIKIFLPERAPSPAPLLQIQMQLASGSAATFDSFRVYGHLRGVQFWQFSAR